MKRNIFFSLICIITLFFAPQSADSQWEQCNVPKGYQIYCLTANGSQIFAGLTGVGLFQSTDKGTNWTGINAEFTGSQINCVSVVGTNIFVATEHGVYLSTDNGTNWNSADDGLDLATVSSFATIGNNLFAGTDAGVYLSTNSGTSWKAVNTGIDPNTAITSLAVIDKNLFAGTNFYGVYLSTNSGASWKTINTGLKTNTTINSLAVIGKNLFAGTNSSVYLSTNNGISWKAVNTGIEYIVASSFAVIGKNLFAGSDKGVYLSTDNGTSWRDVSSGLANIHTSDLAVSNEYLYAGIYFIGSDVSSVWRRPLSEMGTSVVLQNVKLPVLTLNQNYPNPFNTSTSIHFTLPDRNMIVLEVFDMLGRKIRTLIMEMMDAGPYRVEFDGKDLADGVYVAKLTSNNVMREMKMILAK